MGITHLDWTEWNCWATFKVEPIRCSFNELLYWIVCVCACVRVCVCVCACVRACVCACGCVGQMVLIHYDANMFINT